MMIGERIKEVRANTQLTQQRFAERIGLKRNSLAMIEGAGRNPSEPVVRAICREFHISYLWLTEGVEPMYTPEDINVINQLTNIMNSDNEFAKRVFTEFAKMPREAWLALETVIDNLAKK